MGAAASGGVLRSGAGLPVGVAPAAARAGDVERPHRWAPLVLMGRQSSRVMNHKPMVNVGYVIAYPLGGRRT